MESKAKQEKKVSKITTKKDYVTNDQMSDFEKRMETKICYELKLVKLDILKWMIPFHMTTLAFMLTMLYRIFFHG